MAVKTGLPVYLSQAMPSHDRVRLYDDEGAFPLTPQLGEPDPEDPIEALQPGKSFLAREHVDLMAEGDVLEQCLGS